MSEPVIIQALNEDGTLPSVAKAEVQGIAEAAAAGGGGIAGLDVITGAWPPPLKWWEYPMGTLYVRDPEERFGPVVAVRASEGWEALAVDSTLSMGVIEPFAFTSGIARVGDAGWELYNAYSAVVMLLNFLEDPEPGDILCTFDFPGGLTRVQQDCLSAASVWNVGVLTGTVMSEGINSVPVGVHHLIIDPWGGAEGGGFIKYLWTVGGVPPAAGDQLQLSWPVTIHSDFWELPEGGGDPA